LWFLAEKSFGGTEMENLLNAARQVHEKCRRYDITIVSLREFRGFEGTDNGWEHDTGFAVFRAWLDVAEALGTDMIVYRGLLDRIAPIMMPDSLQDSYRILGFIAVPPAPWAPYKLIRNRATHHLRGIAHMAAQRRSTIRVAYKLDNYGLYLKSWRQVITIMEIVNVPNFGWAPDTFHLAAPFYQPLPGTGANTARAGTLGARYEEHDLLALRNRTSTNKVFLLNVADAEKSWANLNFSFTNHLESFLDSLRRDIRVHPGDNGSLPIPKIVSAFTNTPIKGVEYKDWVSIHVPVPISPPNPPVPAPYNFVSPAIPRPTPASFADPKLGPCEHFAHASVHWNILASAMGWGVAPREDVLRAEVHMDMERIQALKRRMEEKYAQLRNDEERGRKIENERLRIQKDILKKKEELAQMKAKEQEQFTESPLKQNIIVADEVEAAMMAHTLEGLFLSQEVDGGESSSGANNRGREVANEADEN
jgi:sugar phosphate isomerase/epimerase